MVRQGDKKFLIFITVWFLVLTLLPAAVKGQNPLTELQSRLTEHRNNIAELEREIADYQKELDTLGKQTDSLEKEIRIIETTRKKLVSDILLSEKQITAATLFIEKISVEISEAESGIGRGQSAIAETLRTLNRETSEDIVTLFLAEDSFADFLGRAEKLLRVHGALSVRTTELKTEKQTLEEKKAAREDERSRLTGLKEKLSDQKIIADGAKSAKDQLLTQTKNREVGYRSLLSDRLGRKTAFENELRRIEEEIRVIIDPKSIPAPGKGIIHWPLDQVQITQHFGNTPFATQNPQIYNGKGHNGIDLRASVGTPLKAALNGVVIGVGDTDLACRGASYGKWVLIRHPNGLSTLYAHLSLIRVAENQKVDTGELLGYTGNTGYTTGPHLHFTVFATEGVSVGELSSKVPGCGTYRLPIAQGGFKSYLNPLSYF